jgi:hypothetical protein
MTHIHPPYSWKLTLELSRLSLEFLETNCRDVENPLGIEAQPGFIEIHPGATEVYNGVIKGCPRAIKFHPGVVQYTQMNVNGVNSTITSSL